MKHTGFLMARGLNRSSHCSTKKNTGHGENTRNIKNTNGGSEGNSWTQARLYLRLMRRHSQLGLGKKKDKAAAAPPPPAATDPWPHTGWKSFSDMFQSHHAGWLFSELRVKLAERVFEPLFGTPHLHASKEGFTFHRPTAGTHGARHPAHSRQHFVCGQPSHTQGEHFDQGERELGLQYIQSATALLDQSEDDACFLCWPGSHMHHQRLTSGTWRGRSKWVPLTEDELESLKAAGLAPKRVPVPKGSVILWRSDLAHCGAAPTKPMEGFRAVAYAAMRPACLTPREILTKKVEAYQRRHTGDHVPSRELWHASKGEASALRPFFDEAPPKLTGRMAQLYGLVAYEGLEAAKAASLHDTPT